MATDNTTYQDGSNVLRTLRGRSVGTDGNGRDIIAENVNSAPWPETPLAPAQTLTVTNSAVVKDGSGGMTVPSGATACFLSVENAPVRFWNTGDAPSVTNGHQLVAGAGPVEIQNVALLQIRAVSASAVVQISYHKYA